MNVPVHVPVVQPVQELTQTSLNCCCVKMSFFEDFIATECVRFSTTIEKDILDMILQYLFVFDNWSLTDVNHPVEIIGTASLENISPM